MPAQLTSLLDVAIVLAGLYIGLSSICSFINEQIATLFQLRGTKLFLGVRNLVYDIDLATAIFNHAAIDTSVNDKAGIRSPSWAPNRPSYVDPHNFAVAFWDELANACTLDPMRRARAAVKDANKALMVSPAAAAARLAAATELADKRFQAKMSRAPTDLLSAAAHFEDLRQVVETLPLSKLRDDAMNLLSGASNDYAALLSATEAWFNRQMDRVSGWYARQAAYIGIGLAVVIVAVTGLDSFEIAQRLYASPAMLASAESQIAGASFAATETDRQQLAKTALTVFEGTDFQQFFHPFFLTASSLETDVDHVNAEVAESQRKDVEDKFQTSKKKLEEALTKIRAKTATDDDKAKLPSLRNDATTNSSDARKAADAFDLANRKAYFDGPGSHIIGWTATIVAISLGAPFWFQVLGRLVNVRAAGPKPAAGQKTS